MSSTSSGQLFCPFRAIGLCSNHIPLAAASRGPESLIATAIGKAFHVYLCEKLRLVFVGTLQPHPLQCLALEGSTVFASYESVIKSFVRGKERSAYLGHEGSVHTLLPFGEHLVSVDDKNNLKIWHIGNKELYGELHFDPSSFQVTCVAHPSTYLNKILLGSRQGQLQLWNIRTCKLVYTFPGWASPVLAAVQSPAVDVVGIGLESGGVVLHNLRYDETVMRFHQEWGPVTGLSFRTDGISTMASASPLGHIAVWDLDNRRLGAVLRDAHSGAVTGMQFLQSQPLLVTSGPDNSLKVWIFDQSDGSARLLRSRCGHSAPPTKIRFFSKGGLGLLSAGLDNSLRSFAINKDAMNTELSQGSLAKKSRKRGVKVETLKLPPITDFASEITRVHDWDSVVTCHSGYDSARTWLLFKSTIGKHVLVSRHLEQGARPQCVTITSCGNFAIIGMTTGHIEIFNMQSGLHRGEFGKPQAHSRPVRGIAVDALNMEVFSGSSDSTVKFWSFHAKSLLHTLPLESPVAAMVYHRESSMLAVACDNFVVLIVDTDTRRIVRTFSGHSNRITDLAFSPDARWLISSGMDCSIRTWDLPTGRLIDCFLSESPATTLAFSPTADFLATAHVDDLGVYLWSNKTLFSHVSLRPLPPDYTPSVVDLPTTGTSDDEGGGERDAGAQKDEGEGSWAEPTEPEDHPAPLREGLVTLSTLPKSRWHNLSQLDIIKQHNKPIEPPKPAKPAPFFLPTLPGLEPKFIPTEDDIPESEISGSRILNLGKLQPMTEFQKCLQQCSANQQFVPLMSLLKTMTPVTVDSELRSLGPEGGGSVEQLAGFMRFLLEWLRTRRDFELTEAYLELFLKLHTSTLPQSPELAALIEELLTEHQRTWKHLQTDLNMSACILGYCKSATV